MKIIVTGAAGFIGSRVCQHLEDMGHQVIRLVHRSGDAPEQLPYFVVDITDTTTLAAVEKESGVDALVHCAAIAHRFGKISRSEYESINVDGSQNVADMAARIGIQQFIHLSSVLVYGEVSTLDEIDESFPLQPADDYAWTKAASENVVTNICSKNGVELVILRPAPVVGEGSRGNIGRLIDAIRGRRFLWFGDGRNRRSFVYVDDVAAAVEHVIKSKVRSGVYNVVGGSLSVRELVATIAEQLGVKVSGLGIPNWIAHIAIACSKPLTVVPPISRMHRTARAWLASAVYSGDALSEIGFEPTTDLIDGLKKEINHRT